MKGDIIEATVREVVAKRKPGAAVAVLEVGGHLGDGTLRIARALSETPASSGQSHVIISTETNAGWASGCKAIMAKGLGRTSGIHHESLVVQPSSLASAAK